jgi:hypothetical protein
MGGWNKDSKAILAASFEVLVRKSDGSGTGPSDVVVVFRREPNSCHGNAIPEAGRLALPLGELLDGSVGRSGCQSGGIWMSNATLEL